MREGWQTRTLGEICDVIGGGTPSKKRSDYYDHGTIPWATVRDMNAEYLTETEFSITQAAIRESPTNIIPANNVVIATRVGLGKVCLLGQDTAINQDLKGILPRSGVDLSIPFLFRWFQNVTNRIVAAGTGATVQGVKIPFIKSLEIPVPSRAEQHRIVAILDEAFEAIATAKANTEKNLQNAREVFESQLEVTLASKKDWKVKTLQQIGVTQTGTTPKKSDASNYGDFIPFVKPGNFNSDGSLNYHDEGLSAAGASKARKITANSVLMVCIGATIGKTGYCDRLIATNQQINSLTPDSSVSHKFLYYQMCTRDFQRCVIQSAGQATLPIINKSKWSALTLRVPDAWGEQMKIVDLMDSLRRDIQGIETLCQSKLAALDELKQSLLHQAFTGALTTRAVDHQLAEAV